MSELIRFSWHEPITLGNGETSDPWMRFFHKFSKQLGDGFTTIGSPGLLVTGSPTGPGGTLTLTNTGVISLKLTSPAAGFSITNSGTALTGTIESTFSLTDDLAALEGISTTGISVRTADNTWAARVLSGTADRLTASSPITGDIVLDISTDYAGQTSITTLGTITTGTWNGTPIAVAFGGTGQTTLLGALNALLPTQTGQAGKVLQTDGTNTLWSVASVGTVTSVAAAGTQGVSISGSPITGSGTITVGLGAITPTSVAASGAVTGSNLSGTNTGDTTVTGTANQITSTAGIGNTFTLTLPSTVIPPGNLSVAVNGASSDPYGAIAVTNPTNANSYSYLGFTRASSAAYNIGIDTSNRLFIGSGAGGYTSNVASRPLTIDASGNLITTGALTASNLSGTNTGNQTVFGTAGQITSTNTIGNSWTLSLPVPLVAPGSITSAGTITSLGGNMGAEGAGNVQFYLTSTGGANPQQWQFGYNNAGAIAGFYNITAGAWAVYWANATQAMTVPSSTASASPFSGALVVTGGVGVQGALNVQGAIAGSNLSGTHTGTSSGTNTGDQTSVTGNAGTATALQNARTINGVSFNGTANITVSQVFVGTFIRNLSTASGSVAYTGVGFTPTSIEFYCNVDSVPESCWGFAAATSRCISSDGSNNKLSSSDCIRIIRTSAGNEQKAVVASYNADGFTLTWTKVGSPPGNDIIVNYIARR